MQASLHNKRILILSKLVGFFSASVLFSILVTLAPMQDPLTSAAPQQAAEAEASGGNGIAHGERNNGKELRAD
jgi:hypothetical protein